MKNKWHLPLLVLLASGSLVDVSVARVTGLPDFTGLVDQAAPAVVNIRVTQYGERARANEFANEAPFEDEQLPEFFRRYFGEPGQSPYGEPDRSGAGSGFIVESDGYIITNHHVVEGADQIVVRLADRREFEAEVVGSDEMSDIALLKIDAKALPTLEFGSSEKLKQGEWVLAIGSPFNFDQSVTAGIVSAKGRSNGAQQYVPFIQTDVAINRGNSGGPLLNMDGEVVGVNSWILSSSGGYIGLSFSIPIEVVASTARQLRETGKVQRGLLGVQVGAVTRELAEAMSLDRPVGALVNDVTTGGAAERAGIAPGDVILAFDNQLVESWNDLPPLVGANPPGKKAVVKVSREGKEQEFEVVLDSLEGDEVASNADPAAEPDAANVLGLEVAALSDAQRSDEGGPGSGVLVTAVQSDEAWRAGLREGDVLLMINNQRIGNLEQFNEAVADLPVGKAVALRVWREGTTAFFAYTPQARDAG